MVSILSKFMSFFLKNCNNFKYYLNFIYIINKNALIKNYDISLLTDIQNCKIKLNNSTYFGRNIKKPYF